MYCQTEFVVDRSDCTTVEVHKIERSRSNWRIKRLARGRNSWKYEVCFQNIQVRLNLIGTSIDILLRVFRKGLINFQKELHTCQSIACNHAKELFACFATDWSPVILQGSNQTPTERLNIDGNRHDVWRYTRSRQPMTRTIILGVTVGCRDHHHVRRRQWQCPDASARQLRCAWSQDAPDPLPHEPPPDPVRGWAKLCNAKWQRVARPNVSVRPTVGLLTLKVRARAKWNDSPPILFSCPIHS